MSKLKKMRKLTYIFIIVVLMCAFLPSNKPMLAESTGLIVSGPTVILEGQNVVFTVQYNSSVKSVNLSSNHVILNGFTATKTVSGSGKTWKVTLSNIKGAGDNKTITIAAGSATLNSGARTQAQSSNLFKIKGTIQQNEKPSTPSGSNINSNTNNNNSSNNNSNTNNNQTNNNTNTQPSENNNTEQNTNNQEAESDWIPNPNTGK
ncbi:MAG: hypothetical protein PHP54_03260 [Clostridia bacterium]|nr:hypothetical protein [Clostridia bacterium]